MTESTARTPDNAVATIIDALNSSDLIVSVEEQAPEPDSIATLLVTGVLAASPEVKFNVRMAIS